MVRTAKVVTSTISGEKNVVVVSDGNIALQTLLRGVDVGLGTSLVDTARRVVRLNTQRLNINVEETILSSLALVPLDGATSPLPGTLSRGITSRPQTELDAARSLRESVITSGGVLRVLLVKGAHSITIDDPLDLVLLPVDGVLVVVLLGVAANLSREHVFVVKLALPVVVALHLVEVITNHLIVNLILHARKKDEVRNDTTATTGLHLDGSLTVPEEVRRGDSRAASALVHLNTKLVVITVGDVTEVAEGVLGSVAQVLGVRSDTIGTVEAELALLVNRHGNTGSRLVRETGVAATETDVAVSASSLGRATGVLLGAGIFALTTGGDVDSECERKNCSSRNVAQHVVCMSVVRDLSSLVKLFLRSR